MNAPINAIVLAGGKSSRFGSNKALYPFQGELMINRVVTSLKDIFKRIYVIGSNDTDYSFLEGVEPLQDIIPDKGPLGGLYTGLKNSTTKYNLLTGCDMPFLTEKYFQYLLDQPQDYDVLVPEYNGYLEPLVGLYSRHCLPAVEEALLADQLKIKSFFHRVRVQVINEDDLRESFDPARLFYNVNYRSDLKQF